MADESEQFISREITVLRGGREGLPVSFDWDGKQFTVGETIAVWSDWGFSAGAPRKKSWRMRRHRNYYRIETTDGSVFELYHDRGLKLSGGKWFLQSRLR